VLSPEKKLTTKEFQDYKNGINNLGIITVGDTNEYQYIVKEADSLISRALDKFRNRKARFKN
ncbi:MAG: hypothetical protein GX981_09860, partial [Tissierellia bacterium]|nr:hypothetical protein [Tissierellia bacterium]